MAQARAPVDRSLSRRKMPGGGAGGRTHDGDVQTYARGGESGGSRVLFPLKLSVGRVGTDSACNESLELLATAWGDGIRPGCLEKGVGQVDGGKDCPRLPWFFQALHCSLVRQTSCVRLEMLLGSVAVSECPALQAPCVLPSPAPAPPDSPGERRLPVSPRHSGCGAAPGRDAECVSLCQALPSPWPPWRICAPDLSGGLWSEGLCRQRCPLGGVCACVSHRRLLQRARSPASSSSGTKQAAWQGWKMRPGA